MMELSATRLITTLVTALVLVGCDHESGASNGIDGVLYFTEARSGDFGGVPLGITRGITVSRHTSGIEVCEPSFSHGGGDCSGGTENDPLTIESATCESHDCKIEINPDRPLIRISSTTPGTTRLRVRVKSKDDDEKYTDAVTVRFAEAKAIQLWSQPADLLPLAMRVANGMKFWAPEARIVDAEGKRLSVDQGMLRVEVEGASVKASDSFLHLSTVTPGRSTLTWDLDGRLKRSLDVEVVEPSSSAKSIVVLPRVTQDRPSAFEPVMELDVLRGQIEAPPIERLERPAVVSGLHYWPVFVVMADGTRAVVPVSTAQISVSTIVPARIGPTLWSVTIPPLDNRAPGTATLRVEVGAVSRDLPIDWK
jgi:hypothetical protein